MGGVVSDEPRATQTGRDILAAGGSAADAAAAVGLALAVTFPSSASLGGGGVCLVHDRNSGRVEALDFLPGAPRAGSPPAARPSAVPGLPRGLYALHSKYGRLRWSQVVSPAERLARFGIPVSRAFAGEIAKIEAPLLADAATRRIFGRPGATGAVREGDHLIQADLATVLSRLRTLEPVDFYAGALARGLVAATREAGGSLTVEDLRDYKPEWRRTLQRRFGYKVVHFAPPPAAAGAVAANLWSLLTRDDAYEVARAEERPHLFAEAALRVFADRGRWLAADGSIQLSAEELVAERRVAALMNGYRRDRHVPAAELSPAPVELPENPSASSFVVVDASGSAVVCALTMNNLFGTGRVAPGTGIVLAMAPQAAGRSPISLGPMLVVNPNVRAFYFAAAASGGAAALTAMIGVALRALIDEQPLEDAIGEARLHPAGAPDLVYHEPGLSAATLKSLTDRQHRIAATPALGLVNAISCPEALPPNFKSCSARADPRGSGYAAGADR